VTVNTAASPPFDDSTDGGLGGLFPLSGGTGTTGADGAGSGVGFTPGTPGTPGSPAGTGTAGATPGAGPGVAALASEPVGLFKGIGAGLIVLGLFLAGILAFALLRADAAVGMLTAAAPCDAEGVAP
jgi:hypothetical protein